MSRKIINYREKLTDEYSITPKEYDILKNLTSNNKQSNEILFLSDKRMDEIKEMVKNL